MIQHKNGNRINNHLLDRHNEGLMVEMLNSCLEPTLRLRHPNINTFFQNRIHERLTELGSKSKVYFCSCFV